MISTSLSSRAKRGICTLFLVALACTPPKEDATSDTTTLPAVDTLKPSTDTLSARDSVPPKVGEARIPITGTKTTKARRDSIIGHDVATPLDPNRKLLDTLKKRPPQ